MFLRPRRPSELFAGASVLNPNARCAQWPPQGVVLNIGRVRNGWRANTARVERKLLPLNSAAWSERWVSAATAAESAARPAAEHRTDRQAYRRTGRHSPGHL